MGELAHSLPWVRDEGELVTELQAGSDSAFDYLVTYYHSSVFNLVYGILSDRADAADVTQEVFLHVFRGIRGFRGGSSLKTWLYRISVRQALNHRRWCWRHHRLQTSIDTEDSEHNAVLELMDEEATPYEQCAAHETQITVRRALASVPPVFRRAGRNFGLSPIQLLARVIFPAALPQILVGLRIALGIAWLVVVAGEMIAVDSGLGYLVIDSRNSGNRYDLVVAAMLVIGLIGLALDISFRRLEKAPSVRWGFRDAS